MGAIAQLEGSWVDFQGSIPAEVDGMEGSIRVVGNEVHYVSRCVPGTDSGGITNLPEPEQHPFDPFWVVLLGLASSDELIPVEQYALSSE